MTDPSSHQEVVTEDYDRKISVKKRSLVVSLKGLGGKAN
jgi:hypothetical protein